MTTTRQQESFIQHFRHALAVSGWNEGGGHVFGEAAAMKHFDLADDPRWVIDDFVECPHGYSVPNTMKSGCAAAICEIVSNVLLHSESECGACIVGEYHPNAGILDIVIYDAGVGFRGKISRATKCTMTAAEAIEWAMIEGHSVIEPSRKGPSGVGLKDVVDFVWQNNGGMQIATGNALWTFAGGKPVVSELREEITGALVKLSFNLQNDYSYLKRVDAVSIESRKGQK